MIELEILVVFNAAIIFTVIYVLSQDLVFGIITWGCWFALGMMWMFISPMSTGYTISFLFQGIGFTFLLSVIVQLLRRFDFWKQPEQSDLD